ncbi:uncharacterized protein LOC106879048 [Octopus bimaculoides]|uniref:ISXO2-like transposase domain-containing protein n=1 Tax=Octopus bimaculoides TaxID=37653 RepID=A0A0L8G588_OCTBM|nr:uncharacterized protein LOC106879048 [Octopus bimaculoides]|eukprot:XP_014783956.1 PREDICTED: uncharacterized protein LOC106879048 [Octopus bimaculoides]
MPRRVGRPRNPTSISNNVMNDNEIKQERWTFPDIVSQTNSIDAAVTWLAKHRLISNSIVCPTCGEPCTVVRYQQSCDGRQWGCAKDRFIMSIRKGSIFAGSHISLSKLIWLMYLWSREHQQIEMSHETDVGERTISDWCHFIRERLEWFLEDHPTELGDDPPEIGGFDLDSGEPIIVEVGMFTFFKSKHNEKKHEKEGHMVFGGIERGTGKCFLVPIEHQNKDAFEAIVTRWILPGTHIVSDVWAEYLQIDQIQQGIYTHEYIDYEDPNDSEIHTRNIDKMWLKVKRKLRQKHGTRDKVTVQSLLTEFMWRSHFKNNDKFAALIYSLRHLYKL